MSRVADSTTPLEFLEHSGFPPDFRYAVEKDFGVDGTPAKWATTGKKPAHRFKDDEDDKIEVFYQDDFSERGRPESASAVSSDGEFIAISSQLVLCVYHIASRKCRARFNSLMKPCHRILFSKPEAKSGYQLIVSSCEKWDSLKDNGLIFFDLNKDGRRVDEIDPLDIAQLVEQSMSPVIAEVSQSHGLPITSPLFDALRDRSREALERLQKEIEAKDLFALQGHVDDDSNPLSSDGRFLLYLISNEGDQDTQDDTRPSYEFVLFDTIERVRRYSLTTEAFGENVRWYAFSPDDQYFAIATWDGTFKIHTTDTGKCEHVVDRTKVQHWGGAWSHDSQHIVICGVETSEDRLDDENDRTFVAVYSLATGQWIKRFEHESLPYRVNKIAWSARGEIAMIHSAEIWIWEPFGDTLVTSFKMEHKDPRWIWMNDVTRFEWADNGRLLVHWNRDGTVEIWDRIDNVKWRLERPKGSTVWAEKQRLILGLSNDSMKIYEF